MNATLEKFGWPESLLRDYAHWVVLLRPDQPTLGSLVLAAKAEATAFGALAPEAHAELARVTADVEAVLGEGVGYARLNYLMLMMVDPHVHFHVIPRYEGSREWRGEAFVDAGWPGVPSLKAAVKLQGEPRSALMRLLAEGFRKRS